ncbi:DNA adenine methylase [Cronobacter sakazakii]|nr:DNA adenine methylase [Cronobacter sakazakii]EGT4327040.1 DNA adenine methylase [Cronobacter sakazakii]EGT4364618.1 DNA adenine methylase [Cronobacter sakazakii]
MNTILKWAGNKSALMPELLKHLPKGPRLVEPFAGSCAVMMATDYPHYLVADINPDLINLYQMIKEDTDKVIKEAEYLFRNLNDAEGYYKVRERFNYAINSLIDRAAYFLYLNRHGYRGLCRYNKKGRFNVPYGNYETPYFPEAEIRAFAEKAKRATFICASFEETLNMLMPGDVIYCDPPYASDDGKMFTSYHAKGFTGDDQYHLASVLTHRAGQGYSVVASNSDSALSRSLYRDFDCQRITAARSIGVAAGKGKSAAEIIAVSKPAAWFGYDFAGARDYSAIHEVRA